MDAIKDLGYRRVQRTGRGSYLVSLPKDWINSLGLKKGAQLAVKVKEDSSILLIPRKIVEDRNGADQSNLKKYLIMVDSTNKPESICRKIISLYVNSADVIHIKFKQDKIKYEYRSAIRNVTKNLLLGTEIINEESDEITLQILVSHPDFSIDSAIRRMTILALSANKDAILALKNRDIYIESINETCNDVKRLNLYVIRQLKYGLERSLFKELGFESSKEFLGYRIVTKDIKSIADNALNIIRNISTMRNMVDDGILFLKEPVDKELYSQILKFNSEARSFFEEALRALFKEDYNLADNLISETKKFATIETELVTLMSSKKMESDISSIFRLILDGARRIIEYGQNITEVTLNRTIEKKNPAIQ